MKVRMNHLTIGQTDSPTHLAIQPTVGSLLYAVQCVGHRVGHTDMVSQQVVLTLRYLIHGTGQSHNLQAFALSDIMDRVSSRVAIIPSGPPPPQRPELLPFLPVSLPPTSHIKEVPMVRSFTYLTVPEYNQGKTIGNCRFCRSERPTINNAIWCNQILTCLYKVDNP